MSNNGLDWIMLKLNVRKQMKWTLTNIHLLIQIETNKSDDNEDIELFGIFTYEKGVNF